MQFARKCLVLLSIRNRQLTDIKIGKAIVSPLKSMPTTSSRERKKEREREIVFHQNFRLFHSWLSTATISSPEKSLPSMSAAPPGTMCPIET